MTQDGLKRGFSKLWWRISLLLNIAGVAVSAYALYHHLEVQNLGYSNAACNLNQSINCDAAALSKYSELFGYPIALLGIVYFLSQAYLLLAIYYSGQVINYFLYSVFSLCGVLASISLAYILFVKVDTVCLTCLSTYSIVLLNALLTGYYIRNFPDFFTGLSLRPLLVGLIPAGALLLATMGIYQFLIAPNAFSDKRSPSATPQLSDANSLSWSENRFPLTLQRVSTEAGVKITALGKILRQSK